MTYFEKNMKTEAREHMRDGDGTVLLTKLVGELPERMRLFSRIVLQPGCSIGVHTHENETELFAFVQGQGEVTDDGETVAVRAGDSMSTPSGHSHGVRNTGDEDLVIVAAIAKD